MGYTDTMLDQARAQLDAGETAAAWELTTAIAKAEPENVRAWELMADIVTPASPERANTYREKARAAAAARNSSALPPHAAPMAPSPAKRQLGEDIVQAEDNLLSQQNTLRALERQQVAARGTRTERIALFLVMVFVSFFFFGFGPLWLSPLGIIPVIISAMAASSAGSRVDAIEKDIGSAEAAITDSQQQLHRLRMQFSMML
jgi:hypothetical protein